MLSRIDKGSATSAIAYSQLLPAGYKVAQDRNGEFDLAIEKIPGIPEEKFAPPMDAFAYRVRFYYTSKRPCRSIGMPTAKAGHTTSTSSHRRHPRSKARPKELTAGAATEDEKLNKLYDAV